MASERKPLGPLKPDEIARMQKILADIQEALAIHERQDHNGTPCLAERVNTVAWLIHCLGLTDLASTLMLQLRVMTYEERHRAEVRTVKNN